MSAQIKSIKVIATVQKRTSAKVNQTIFRSDAVYKGAFATIADLANTSAYKGDYADVFETNTRWQYIDKWIDTGIAIPFDNRYASQNEIDDINSSLRNLKLVISTIGE